MTKRFHGLDLIRLVSFFAIVTFHVSLIHYHTPAIDIAERSLVIRATEQISRLLSFSGFTICFLTSILTAYSGANPKKRVRLFAFLSVGWVIFSALMADFRDVPLVWDIYPLVFTGILSATLVELIGPRALVALGLTGFSLLWIPVWRFVPEVAQPSTLLLVLGLVDCSAGPPEWTVLPWVGLVWSGYALGALLRANSRLGAHAKSLRMERSETLVWAALGVATLPLLGSFYQIKLGSAFSCEAYRQPPANFWAHFYWPVLAIRLSLEPRVQAWLEGKRWVDLISRLAVSRKFWLAYITNYIQAYILSFIVTESGVEQTDFNVPTIAVIAVFGLPLTELIVRGELMIAERAKSVWVRYRKAAAPSSAQRTESGMALITAIMALAVIGVMLSAVTMYISNRIEQRRIQQILDGRRVAYDYVRSNASYPDPLYISSLGARNPLLSQCLNVGDGNCQAVGTANIKNLTLYSPMARTPLSLRAVRVTATTQGPLAAHFSSRGLHASCSPSVTCPFWARTWFWVTCPNGAAICDQADRVFVRSQILRHTGVTLPAGLAIREFPPNSTFAANPMFEAASVSVIDIMKLSGGRRACPANSHAEGTTGGGSFLCKCNQNTYESGVLPNRDPICTALPSCPPGEVYAGTTSGGTPFCYAPPPTSYTCYTKKQFDKGNATCNAGDKMQAVQVGAECDVINDYVECPDLYIKCCKKL